MKITRFVSVRACAIILAMAGIISGCTLEKTPEKCDMIAAGAADNLMIN